MMSTDLQPTTTLSFRATGSKPLLVHLFVKGGGPPNSWTLSSRLVNGNGHGVTSGQVTAFLHQHCPHFNPVPPSPPPGGGIAKVVGPDAGRACLAQVAKAFNVLVTYQPGSRYWAFQWIESGIFVALAIAAAAACYFWVTRRKV